MHGRASLARVLFASPAALAMSACTVPIAGALDDVEANRVVLALERADVDATKEPDGTSEGKWRVDVARDDVLRALSVLREEELPRAEPPGLLDAVSRTGALVPSEEAERAELMAGVAGDLERSLERIDGVLSARVHVSVAAAPPSRDAPATRASASVLLEHRGSTPPLGAGEVARLVAGAVAGLAPADVAVVMISRPGLPGLPTTSGAELGHVGPIAVARTSVRALQLALAGLIAVAAMLASATLVLYSRLSRWRAEAGGGRDEPKSPAA